MSTLILFYDLLAETEVYAYPADELLWHQQPRPSLGNLPYLQNLAVVLFLISNDFQYSISYLMLYTWPHVLDCPSTWRRKHKCRKDVVCFLCTALQLLLGKSFSKYKLS